MKSAKKGGFWGVPGVQKPKNRQKPSFLGVSGGSFLSKIEKPHKNAKIMSTF
jgi:hypothetical protein